MGRLVLAVAAAWGLSGCGGAATAGPGAGDGWAAEAWAARYEAAHPLAGRVWSTSAAAFVPPADLVAALAPARVVLLGERHDHPDHHRLQAWLVDALLRDGRPRVVGFEMVDAEDADALAALEVPRPQAVAEAVDWKASGWPPFALYQPVFAAIHLNGGRVLAAHPDRAVVAAVMKGGLEALPPELRADLPLAPLPPAAAEGLAADIRAGHCGVLPEVAVAPMAAAQRLKDAWMAARLAEAGDAVLVAGNEHVRADRGVPLYLERLGAGPVATVGFLEVRPGVTDPAAYGPLPYDFVWFTPRVDDVDPCARFREQLERLRGDPAPSALTRPGGPRARAG